MAKILAVDDSVSMRQMVAFTLQGAGHDVSEAVDGMDALKVAQAQGSFDLIISDINMPNMDGIALVKQLRTIAAFKFTPILMLTTESAEDKKGEGKAAGATGWIIKPFNPEQLLTTIAKVLG
jgi:two-component system chemotaxis response regulator CheY